MKKIKFFAMALAALTIASCSKEAETIDTPMPESKATITISIVGQKDPAESKAVGPVGTGDTKVNDYIVFLFNSKGGIVGEPTYVSKDLSTPQKIKGSTAAKKVYVIANTGELTTGPLKVVNSEDQLKVLTAKLLTGEYKTDIQTNTNLWMTGVNDIGDYEPGATSEDPSTASATVTMFFMAARINVTVVDARENNTVGDDKISIADKGVTLLFAGADGRFFGTKAEQATQTAFFSGRIADLTSQSTEGTALYTPVTTSFKDAGNKGYYFYTFGNDGKVTPTILAIHSQRKDRLQPAEDIYYPIQFNLSDAGYTVVPGNQYNVELKLTGDVNGGGGGGTTDPEEELKSADITVTVTPAVWETIIPVKKEFN